MKKIILSTDSTCDFPKELVEKYNVQILMTYVHLDDKDYRDSIDITPDYIYKYYEEKKVLPKTSASNFSDYREHFIKWDPEKYDIIHVTIGSAISAAYQNAVLSSEDLDNVFVINSKALSAGSSLLLLKAVELIKQNYEVSKIVEILRSMAKNIEVSFVIDSITYLKEGGRLNSLQAFGANLLSIKPCVEVNTEKDGVMEIGKKYRGKFLKVMKSYISDRLSNRTDICPDRVIIVSSGTTNENLEFVVNTVKEFNIFNEIIITRAGCTISSHCGYNSIGLMFMKK